MLTGTGNGVRIHQSLLFRYMTELITQPHYNTVGGLSNLSSRLSKYKIDIRKGVSSLMQLFRVPAQRYPQDAQARLQTSVDAILLKSLDSVDNLRSP